MSYLQVSPTPTRTRLRMLGRGQEVERKQGVGLGTMQGGDWTVGKVKAGVTWPQDQPAEGGEGRWGEARPEVRI